MAFIDHKVSGWTNPIVNEADRPQRSAADMKAVFDSNSNQLKEALNALIDGLTANGAAAEIKLANGDTVSEALDALSAAVAAALAEAKAYTDDAVIAAGAADMTKAVYDPTGKEQDMFAYADAKAVKSTAVAVTLTAGGWSGNTQTVTVTGLTATGNGTVGVAQNATTEQREAARAAMLSVTGQTAGRLTISADGDVPAVNIPLTVTILG